MKYTSNLKLKKPDGTDVVNVDDLNDNADKVDKELASKVDKINGKGLSTNDYTDTEKQKLEGIQARANKYTHPSTHPASMIKTSDGKNVEEKLGEVFQSVSNGKGKIATAITDKGVDTNSSDAFQKMADNIESIETDKTGDATASSSDILKGKTAYVKGKKLAGSMPNNGSISKTITSQNGKIYIPKGYHSGSGYVKAQFANLMAENIKKGVNIGGVDGNYEGTLIEPGTSMSTETSIKVTLYNPNDFKVYPQTIKINKKGEFHLGTFVKSTVEHNKVQIYIYINGKLKSSQTLSARYHSQEITKLHLSKDDIISFKYKGLKENDWTAPITIDYFALGTNIAETHYV